MTNVRVITEALGGSLLSRALQAGNSPAGWAMRPPAGIDAWRTRVAARAASHDWKSGLEALMPAFDASGLALERLQRVKSHGGVMVTTGQQPGLFGGPIYTWSKAMSALALADAIERETGTPTVAVFWAATDDADFDEAAVTMIARHGDAERILAPGTRRAAGTPMSLVPLGDVSPMVHRLRTACGSVADPRALQALTAAYQEIGATHGSAYVAMLREILAPFGIPVIDASHDAVRAASDDVLRMALRAGPAVERALEERATEIRAAGYEPQVDDVGGLSLVFVREGDVKRRIPLDEAPVLAATSDVVLTPNVLLRPVVEYVILPTVAYIAGPGELAYFAQVGSVADALQIEKPLAVPRWSCTLIEPQIDNLLHRFDIGPEALARPHVMERVVARGTMSGQTSSTIAALREVIDKLPSDLASETRPMGLEPAVVGAMRALHHRVDRIERRIVAGIKRRETALLDDIGTLRGSLYPFGKKQERALNIVPMLSRHGISLLDDMRENANIHAVGLLTGAASSVE